MKIVEFGDDGKPRPVKGAEPALAPQTGTGAGAIKVREFGGGGELVQPAVPRLGTGKIKIREFDGETRSSASAQATAPDPAPFGAARVPQTIRIVDFDKVQGHAKAKPSPTHERPRGMKIIETD